MLIKTWYKDETVIYATEELKKYLDIMHPGFCSNILIVESTESYKSDGEIKLGLLSDFNLSSDDVNDVLCDDVVYIDVTCGSGIIAGSNIRSILLSVYAYLRAAGCVFLRPGEDGEIIPQRDMRSFSYTYRKKADYPFRGECIEGAVSFEHVRDTVIWSPKVGMNMFMIQQIVPYNLMSRWYMHTSNTLLDEEDVDFDDIADMTHSLELLIKKCGLQFHDMGHGYLLEPYGIHYKTINDKYELNDEARQDIAIVNGKKELFLGSPNFTHLCYSDKNVRNKLVNWLVEYMRKKPHIDFLHIWLADSYNNQCECDNCINQRVSDLYVKLLNEIDDEFTRLGINSKIVFILYVDTLWPPLYEKIKNPDRFYMMAAIGGRDYSKPYDLNPYEGVVPQYVKNKYSVENTFSLRMKFVDGWRKAFNGSLFFCEYHMYIHQYNDPGFMKFSKLWYEDIIAMKSLGVSGMMNIQTQRSFFPNGLPISLYAAVSFDTGVDFNNFTDEYFRLTYGNEYNIAKDYLSQISGLMNPELLQVKKSIADQDVDSVKKVSFIKPWVDNLEAQEKFRKVVLICDKFEKIIKEKCNHPCTTVTKSWKLLWYHTDWCKRYANILLEHSMGNNDMANKLLCELTDRFSHFEPEIGSQFDLFLFDNSVKRKLS